MGEFRKLIKKTVFEEPVAIATYHRQEAERLRNAAKAAEGPVA